MRKLHLLLIVLLPLLGLSQSHLYEKPPVFPNCENTAVDSLKICFTQSLNQHIFDNFKTPEVATEANYKGDVKVLFEVDKNGVFNIIYIDAIYPELKTEVERVFGLLPKIKPGTYNSNAIFFQYSMPIQIPLVNPALMVTEAAKNAEVENEISNEIDSINASTMKYDMFEYSSTLNIPFTHNYYSKFDAEMNMVGTNSHTASKPFMYDEVKPYYDLKAEKESLSKSKDTWFSRKFWDEHLVELQAKDYWLIIDPVFDLAIGKDTDADFSYTFNNTRGIVMQGGFGKKFSFSTSFLESQGRFPQYFNSYAERIKAYPEAGIIPGRGIAKRFKEDAFDYPVAEAYLSYTPAKFMNVQFGHGRNFIGDGYRSLLQSDVSSPHTYLKLNAKFWKIKYTSNWMWLRDVRDEVIVDDSYLTKYMANHYLSWNISKKFNLGLFESVMWTDTNGRGFDINYLNPIIFFRALEFESGQGSGNAILGMTAKYKWNNKFNLYGQFILDEFSLEDVKARNDSWKNKFGFQLGAKYYNAFNVKNLLLQFEYNQVRPYTYSHNTIVNNYAHNNQPMAHLWGANFKEGILIARYNYKRWSADAKLIFGLRGLDFDDGSDDFSYGGDIYRDYNERPFDNGVVIGQGNKTHTINAELQGAYILNVASNLRLFGSVIYRDFDPESQTATTFSNSTVWFNFGLRTDIFNWYYDL
ncbi:MAG: gliding motility protein RemB [Bacteroidetes bacterium MedPE-SWsnd-G2]|nr:MAG: gliding motility protein RemB [Bacteroidetes bacterium MedPE-SWsnd-G2]